MTDLSGMRPTDLLAFKIDDDQKNFIKEYHGEQKNFKISKQYEVYTWGRSEGFNLGYAQLNEERILPKKVRFPGKNRHLLERESCRPESLFNDQESIKDIKISETFSLALNEDG